MVHRPAQHDAQGGGAHDDREQDEREGEAAELVERGVPPLVGPEKVAGLGAELREDSGMERFGGDGESARERVAQVKEYDQGDPASSRGA